MTAAALRSADRTADTTAPLVIANQVTKAFAVGRRQIEILHGVSLQVRPSEMVAVMGPSGSGKSTLMYCLAGLEPVTSGDVLIAGKSLAGMSRGRLAQLRRRDIGFVFQQYNLIPTLSAYENVALPYRLRREAPPRELIEGTLEAVGLAALRNAMPTSMSGGEQQRVALARVLAQRPQVIFADEPTGALDTNTGRAVLAELAEIAHKPGQCVLTVTHDPAVAATCDRVLFLSDGHLVDELHQASAEQVSAVLTGLAASVGPVA